MRIHLFLWHAGHGRIDLQYKYIHFSFQHLPSACLWGLYVQKYRDTFIEVLLCDLAERFGHLVFSPVFIFQPSSTTSPSSRFTIFWILHYQLQFRDYGGSLAHRLQARFLLYAAGTYISRFAEEGSRTFFLLTSLQIRVRQRSTTSQRRLRSQFSRYFTVNSTFETLGEALHIVSNLAFSHMQLECTFFFC